MPNRATTIPALAALAAVCVAASGAAVLAQACDPADLFGPPVRFDAGVRPGSVALGDLDGDGDLDMAVANLISNDVGILLNRCGPFAACPADLDADGELTIFDFLAFQNLFDAMDPIADFDGDGAFTIFDFLAFQNAFDAGCP
jgi:hypothetical protein